MAEITLDVWLYGPLARYGGDADQHSFANITVTLPAPATVADLLGHLKLPTQERGITFINGQLSAMPGLQPDQDQVLQHCDRVAFFHLNSMWPFQYRDGAALAPGMARAIREAPSPFHSPKTQSGS